MMSCTAAPFAEVTTPIRLGNPRQRACFLSTAKIPSAASLALSCSSASASSTEPRRLREVGVELHLAVAVVDADPPAHAEPLARLDLEAHPHGVAAPHHGRKPATRDRAAKSRGAPTRACSPAIPRPRARAGPSRRARGPPGAPPRRCRAAVRACCPRSRPTVTRRHHCRQANRRNRRRWRTLSIPTIGCPTSLPWPNQHSPRRVHASRRTRSIPTSSSCRGRGPRSR